MNPSNNSLRSPLGRVRGLGSAKEGTHHWWAQRVTAVALIPLTIWFVYSLLGLAGGDLAAFTGWLSSPINATLMTLVVAVGFHHAQLGLQVVFEDYVVGHATRIAINMIVKFLCYGLGALSIVSILIVAFGR
ncbi:MAG: succinate dehydrogenase, hydrophobic membrane anchor protein [Alphaproteobacteria bacterium]|nr:succinate dehydrogenase, hydrophobic membrane anchor protein [Alphaproteobacteria bacterium]